MLGDRFLYFNFDGKNSKEYKIWIKNEDSSFKIMNQGGDVEFTSPANAHIHYYKSTKTNPKKFVLECAGIVTYQEYENLLLWLLPGSKGYFNLDFILEMNDGFYYPVVIGGFNESIVSPLNDNGVNKLVLEFQIEFNVVGDGSSRNLDTAYTSLGTGITTIETQDFDSGFLNFKGIIPANTSGTIVVEKENFIRGISSDYNIIYRYVMPEDAIEKVIKINGEYGIVLGNTDFLEKSALSYINNGVCFVSGIKQQNFTPESFEGKLKIKNINLDLFLKNRIGLLYNGEKYLEGVDFSINSNGLTNIDFINGATDFKIFNIFNFKTTLIQEYSIVKDRRI